MSNFLTDVLHYKSITKFCQNQTFILPVRKKLPDYLIRDEQPLLTNEQIKIWEISGKQFLGRRSGIFVAELPIL